MLIIVCAILLSGCADSQPALQTCLEGHIYGFWGGAWHGMIAPFDFIASLFWSDVAIYAVNNNGGWYNLGFILGTGALSGGSIKASKR